VLYLEDFAVGDRREFGRYPVTSEEVIDFGRKYDPQPFHIDPEAAAETHFGGLIASGWHTCGMFMKMLADDMVAQGGGSLGSPGVDEIRWLKPVRPGDELSVRSEVVEVRPSKSKPDRGIVRSSYEIFTQDGAAVMTLTSVAMMNRRPGTATATSNAAD